MKPEGPVFDKAWRSASQVKPVPRSQVDWMIRRHYLEKWPGVVVLALGLEVHGFLLGVVVYALPPIQTNVRYGGKAWELARLWIDDSVPKNAETYLIAASVRHIRRRYPEVDVLVSYADPSVGHQGTIYVAAGWERDGRTDEGRKTARCDYKDPRSGKTYSRMGHIPAGVEVVRVPRVSKSRYIKRLR